MKLIKRVSKLFKPEIRLGKSTPDGYVLHVIRRITHNFYFLGFLVKQIETQQILIADVVRRHRGGFWSKDVTISDMEELLIQAPLLKNYIFNLGTDDNVKAQWLDNGLRTVVQYRTSDVLTDGRRVIRARWKRLYVRKTPEMALMRLRKDATRQVPKRLKPEDLLCLEHNAAIMNGKCPVCELALNLNLGSDYGNH